MMQHTVIGVHDNHHNRIHQDDFQGHPPEKAGVYTFLFNDQECSQKADKSAEDVQKHKVYMLGPAAHPSFVHAYTCFP